VDAGFIPLWLGLTSIDSFAPPSTGMKDPASAAAVYPGHLANAASFTGPTAASMVTGGDLAYDGPFFQQRSPLTRLASLRVPVALVGGWWDIFQRGQPLLFEKLANSPDKVWFQSPRYHGADPAIWAQMGIGTQTDVMHRWFGRWLRDEHNGADHLPPVNLHAIGADHWVHSPAWPLPTARYTRYHLAGGPSGSANSTNDGTLQATEPPDGSDVEPLLPASSPCSRLTFQWTGGIARTEPCETDNSSYEASALTYTTPPLAEDTEVTGHMLARVWAELTGASDATMTAVLSDVGPDGRSTQVTAGFLLASQRAVDPERSTFAKGVMIRPFHPFTKASQQPVASGEATPYDIEIYPTSAVFAAGHRIRLTIGTANTPGTVAPAPAAARSTGAMRVLHGPGHDSYVQLPVIPQGS
jgi:putative CocE/NonD family hydrolase